MKDCTSGSSVTIGFYGPKIAIVPSSDPANPTPAEEKCKKAGFAITDVSNCHQPRTFGWPTSQNTPMPLSKPNAKTPIDLRNSTSWVYGQGEDGEIFTL